MKRKSPFSNPSKRKRQKTDADSEVKTNSITFKAEKMEENTNNILPYEILLQILLNLTPKDRSKAAVTCHSWRACCLDDSLGWYHVARKTLRETIRNYEHRKLKAPGQYPNLQKARQANTSDLQFDEDILLLEAQHSVSYYWVKHNGQYHLVLCSTNFIRDDWNSGTYRHRISARQNSFFSPNTDQDFSIDIEANVRRIERRVQNGETIGIQDDLGQRAAKHYSDTIVARRKNWNSAYLQQKYDPLLSYTPQVNAIVVAQDMRLTGVKLHDYQLRAINFMVSVEQERKERKFSPLVRVPDSYLLINPLKQCLVLPVDAEEHDLTFTVKGGVLADEMGLGKSIEVLGLILHCPMTQAPNEDKLLVSKATLIFCPNHLVQQWQNEIEKHTEPKLKVISITTIHHVKKYTPHDVMNADVVIATYNLLQNSNYINYPNGEGEERLDHIHLNIRHDRLDQLLTELKQRKKGEQTKGVVLEHYRWHRIVLDEGHEILKDKSFRMMQKFVTTHKWFVSGTPFPRSDDIVKVRQWLDVAIHRLEAHELALIGNHYDDRYRILQNLVPVDNALSEMFFKEMIWRNTKKSVNVEYEMVAVTEEIQTVNLSPLERAIYTHFMFPSRSEEARASLCTMSSDWGNNNEERKKYFVALRKGWIKQVEIELEELNTKHKFYKAKLEKRQKTDPNNTSGLGAATEFMRNYPKASESMNEKLASHKERLALFENLELDEDNEEGHTTKLRELVSYLKDLFERDPAKRVIIFSQYHDFLEQIGRELTKNDILTTNLKGNVYQKTNGLNKFKANKSDVKVMLMSFNKTASGTNLIEASHVIFTDQLDKTPSEVKAIESQAIGRAQRQGQTQDVTLVRFLAADTVETKLNQKSKQ